MSSNDLTNLKFYLSTNKLFIILFTLLTFAYCSDPKTKLEGLYDIEDNVVVIKGDSSYNEIMLTNQTALAVEFYNSWCGHCIRFAPTWKALSKNIIGWNSVIRLVTVDCNCDDNANVCRKMNINEVPNIKLFSDERLPSDSGIDYKLSDGAFSDATQIEDGLVSFLMSTNTSSSLRAKLTFNRNLDSVAAKERKMFIVFENSTSHLGRKLVLDFIVDRRMSFISVTSSSLSSKYNISLADMPSVYRVQTTSKLANRISSGSDNHLEVRRRIVLHMMSSSKVKRTRKTATTAKEAKGAKEGAKVTRWVYRSSFAPYDNNQKYEIEILPANEVYTQDLLSALHYSMMKEVANNRLLEGARYTALAAYIRVLRDYFPPTTPGGNGADIIAYLGEVDAWLDARRGTTGQEWLSVITALQIKHRLVPLKKADRWLGCRGSMLRYRGFPCSVWRLFHTLTVSAYEIDDNTHSDGQDTLIAMRLYIEHFFGCRECALNFGRGAKHIEAKVHSRKDAILFLWKSHNKANKHLKGDLTEDPGSPKIQFPSKELCKECFVNAQDTWDENEVFMFLRLMYRRQNIIGSSVNNGSSSSSSRSSSSRSDYDVRPALPSSTGLMISKFDISLCAAFYILCMALLFNVFARIRRRRAKAVKSI